jgi:hypothetical protein
VTSQHDRDVRRYREGGMSPHAIDATKSRRQLYEDINSFLSLVLIFEAFAFIGLFLSGAF